MLAVRWPEDTSDASCTVVKVVIYNEPAAGSIGGAEYSALVLAQALAGMCDVEVVHHRPNFSREIEILFGEELLSAALNRVVPEHPNPFPDSILPWRRYKRSRNWQRSLSDSCDIFINFAHYVPPFCHARQGILMLLFPMFDCRSSWPRVNQNDGTVRASLRRCYSDWEWTKRLDTYQRKFANSRFTSEWASKRWGITCDVMYPPVDTSFPTMMKENLIVSVGRFNHQNGKKQKEMIGAFKALLERAVKRWCYSSAGALGNTPVDQAYFTSLAEHCGRSMQITLIRDLPHKELRQLLARAKIFWHAAGYSEQEDVHPELVEHFGIATVEAMAAGCVPIVYNAGGQKEIIQHAANGFLWRTLEELQEYTRILTERDDLRADMSAAAIKRAKDFSINSYVGRFLDVLGPLLGRRKHDARR